MSSNNGKANPGPLFAMFFQGNLMVAPRNHVLEQLLALRQAIPPIDLQSGPILDEFTDDFRKWSTVAEEGMIRESKEVNACVIRLKMSVPSPSSFVSTKAMGRMGATMTTDQPPDDQDAPRIVSE